MVALHWLRTDGAMVIADVATHNAGHDVWDMVHDGKYYGNDA